MSLEEEIAIYRFGQEVHSDKNILDRFSQLDEDIKRSRLYDLYILVLQLNPIDADIEQAISDSSLNPVDEPCVTLKARGLRQGVVFLPDGDNESVFQLLLHVFKLAYQRHYRLKKGNATDWWYLDLSKSEIVQELLIRHRELAEEIYDNPSFRSELLCLAKLWFEHRTLRQIEVEEPVPETQTKFDFLTYNEILTEPLPIHENKHAHAIGVLQNSVSKGLALRYKLEIEQARLLLMDVIQRHMQELYNLERKPYF